MKPANANDPLRTTDHEPGATPSPECTADFEAGSPGADGRTATQLPGRKMEPNDTDRASDLPTVPGYRVLREIARGGMGRVLAAFDLGLDRAVALKILLPGAIADRFVRESKITARLPHPGIPPVHALGTLADGSPFLAMKLIAGQTLADEMKTADRPRLLQAFAQVCQAVGFAHSRGVIHRDLKPANVMVGAFGEVQVMDWGLAKDLTSRENSDEARASEALTVPIVGTDTNQTPDSSPAEPTDDQTQAGTILGTPAYMAPEQARGEATDDRADVFALGGILCAILTGKPPFSGKSAREVIQRAGAADLAKAHARLNNCGADAELVALCRRCLSPNPKDRPANGQGVADGLTAYLNGVQERLHAAMRERAVTETKMAEQRKRQRLRLALAGVLVLLVGGAGFGAWKAQQIESARAAEFLRQAAELESRRADTERDVNEAVQKVEVLLAQAPYLSEQPEQWEAVIRSAFAGVNQAEGVFNSGEGSKDLREQVRRVRARTEEAERVRKFVERLDDISTERAEKIEDDQSIGAYDAAFRDFGLHPALIPSAALAEQIRAHSHAEVIAAALIDWNELAGLTGVTVPGLFDTVKALWSDVELIPANNPGKVYATQIFRPRSTTDKGTRDEPIHMADLSPRQIETVANRLLRKGLERDAGELLSSGIGRHPRDFRLRILLGYVCIARSNPPLAEHAVRNFGVAIVLRPKSVAAWTNQGNALFERGETGSAKAALREALKLNPNASLAKINLATIHAETGEPDEALKLVNEVLAHDPKAANAHYLLGILLNKKGDKDGAETAYRRAIELNPSDTMARGNLALLLSGKGDGDAALALLTAALKAAPKDAKVHANLGALHLKHDAPAEALKLLSTAVELDPKYAKAWMNLGRARLQTGDKDGAVVALLKAANLDPNDAATRFNLAVAFVAQRQFDKAIAAYRKAIECDPTLLQAHNNLGTLLLDKGDPAGAARCFGDAAKLDPKNATAQRNRGAALMQQGAFKEAVPAFREAAKLDPEDGWAHFGLANCLANSGEPEAAVPAYREAIRFMPKHHLAHYNLGIALAKLGDRRGAADAFRGAIKVEPDHADSQKRLGDALQSLKDFDGAVTAYREAVRLNPRDMQTRNNQGNALRGKGDLAGAEAAFREAIKLDPSAVQPHYNLAGIFHRKNDFKGAAAEYREAIRLAPNYAEAYCNLGSVLSDMGQFADALEMCRRGHQIGSKRPNWPYPSAQWVKRAEELARTDARLTDALAGKLEPASADEALVFASFCVLHRERFADAVRFYTAVFAADPGIADRKIAEGVRFQAARAAVVAASGKGTDPPPAAHRAKMREQARAWLAADLALYTKHLETGKPADRVEVQQKMLLLQTDSALAGIRDAAALAKLPADEQKAFTQLWTDAAALLKKALGPIHEIGKGLELRGQLDKRTPTLVYQVKLGAGKTYVIDMVSPDQIALDPYLVLTDATGKKLAEDDDGGDGLNARIVFRAEQAGTFRIQATTFNAGVGDFILTVREQAKPK